MLLLFAMNSSGQKAVVQGHVTDADSGGPLPGVNVVANSLNGVSTDINGYYMLRMATGKHKFLFTFLGFTPVTKVVSLQAGDTLTLNIQLKPSSFELETMVVSAGKFEQRLSDVTVSMAIIQPAFIENTNTVNMETAINQIPGVDILDGQPGIRGGSGYSYGAGSRVLVLLNDLPILTADVGEVKWNFIPVENIEQVEILKGASSALYGSSALNGVINIRTAWPDEKPKTSINVFNGIYLKPRREELAWWWDKNPMFGGINISDSRKLGATDLVTGINAFSDAGYRQQNFEERIRANVRIRHRDQKVKGLTYGLGTNIQWQHNSDFFIWQNADSGAFLQKPDVVTPTRGFRLNADPWISFYDNNSNRHHLKTRYYKVYNRFNENPDKNNGSDLWYGEYQFQRSLLEDMNLTTGISGLYGVTNANLYGDHYNSTIGLFTQLDFKFLKKVSGSLGFRYEWYMLDNKDKESSPVLRAGLNYQVAKATFIRASFGQGYRFPSIAEKYTATSLGSLNIIPNPGLQSERGWSAEIGVKQGLDLGSWQGYFDVAGFWTEYNNMIEFVFGVWPDDPNQPPTIYDIGFKSLNIGKARINGIDVGFTGKGRAGKVPVTLFAGYTYMNPIDLSSDTLSNDILKYRYHHSLKGDVQVDIHKFGAGVSFLYNSFMERIDAAFEEPIFGIEIFPGMKSYRQLHNSGSVVIDLRLSYQLSSAASFSILARNAFNEEYMGRPGDIQAPLNITGRLTVSF